MVIQAVLNHNRKIHGNLYLPQKPMIPYYMDAKRTSGKDSFLFSLKVTYYWLTTNHNLWNKSTVQYDKSGRAY